MKTNKGLYKHFKKNRSGYLKVSELHEIYWEESGNPEGIPVVHLHGGPGSKSKSKSRKFFNPNKWRLIMFDQRGCGKSKPQGEIKENSTWDLVDDMEKLREKLSIDKWVVFGGSWGSTLGIAYAEKYPKRVLGLIMRSIFLFREEDVDWLIKGKGLRKIFPDVWEKRVGDLKKLNIDPEFPEEKLFEKLTKGTEEERLFATIVSENWEKHLYKVDTEIEYISKDEIEEQNIYSQKILLHYVVNNGFFKKNQLLKEADRLNEIPTAIIHGRYDVVCPLDQAWELHKNIPGSELIIVPAAGHHSTEPGILKKIIEYTDKFAERFS